MPRLKKDKSEIWSYRNDFAREHYDTIRAQAQKADGIPARLDAAITAGKATSRQAYIIAAIKKQLDADGIPAPTASSTSTAPGEEVKD